MVNIKSNEPQALQITALHPDGSKIGRKMRGPAAGTAIKLDPDDMVGDGLGVTEGFETGLAVALQGWRPIWAAGSAGAIRDFPVLSGIEALTVFSDNDSSGTGLEAARKCAHRWREADREIEIKPPT
jgi:hypothetical protein